MIRRTIRVGMCSQCAKPHQIIRILDIVLFACPRNSAGAATVIYGTGNQWTNEWDLDVTLEV
jgi:hypothetical protein